MELHKESKKPINWTSQQQREYLQLLKAHTILFDPSCIIVNFPIEEDEVEFTAEELLSVLSSKKKSTASGLGGIKYDFIKALSSDSKNNLVEVINKYWRNCDILEDWRRIKIVPIPKKEKKT